MTSFGQGSWKHREQHFEGGGTRLSRIHPTCYTVASSFPEPLRLPGSPDDGGSNLPSSNFDQRVPPHAPWFEPSRVRTLIYVCMHMHPWFESPRSSNVS